MAVARACGALLLLLLALGGTMGCGSASPPAKNLEPVAQPQETKPAVRPAHDLTFANLKGRLSELRTAAIVGGSEKHREIALNADELAVVSAAIKRCTVSSDSFAATPAPWSEVIQVVAANGDEWFFQLTAQVLRMDSKNPRSPSLESMQTEHPTVQDCLLHEDDDPAVWQLMRTHLGATDEKSYKAGPRP